eukprot:3272982-Rhodomonas_salina.1
MSWGLSGGVGGRGAKSGGAQSRKQGVAVECPLSPSITVYEEHDLALAQQINARIAQLAEELEAHEQRVKARLLDPERQ